MPLPISYAPPAKQPRFGVSAERTGWRDAEFSQRHRNVYGWDVPMVDVDFLACEYDQGKAVAVIDYKCGDAGKPRPITPANRNALCSLAQHRDGDLPALMAVYWKPEFAYKVVPLNGASRKVFASPCEDFTEYEYVGRLYRLRGRAMPSKVGDLLNHESPPSYADGWYGEAGITEKTPEPEMNAPTTFEGSVLDFWRDYDAKHGTNYARLKYAQMFETEGNR